ncbi:MAG: hypothetical protein CVU64_07840 [Deltaproteobacteria bacterium HGW-Deltaproteobacteria-21]|nr:MAG: hypothetical protein CVU64_07840 [Deltaproteobacteria bacterium HGW-Deltaproteobacteria-21]
MTRDPAWLLDFKSDSYSQSGEDGIVEKILQILPKRDKWCVEFGAWDGIFKSNSRNLIKNAGYSSVLIEGSKTKYYELQKNYSSTKNVIALNSVVGFKDNDNLDVLLADVPMPSDFDFLSIDVDGNDYHIWKAISKYRPKTICVEFNPTIPTEVEFVQSADPSVSQGAGLLPLVKLGKEKGYELVSVLSWNAFFVDAKYYPLFEITDNRPETLRKDLSRITHLFSGYDGTIFLHGYKRLHWHDLRIKESKIQQLPGFLRKYPGNYNLIEKMAFAILILFSSPSRLFRKISRRLTQHST